MLTALIGNTWGGRMQDTLLEFIKDQSQDAHLMGLQEVNRSGAITQFDPFYVTNKSDLKNGWHDQIMLNQFEMLKRTAGLKFRSMYAVENTQTYACATSGKEFRNTDYGNALFFSRSLQIIDQGEVFVLGSHNQQLGNASSSRIMQYVVFRYGSELYLFAHYHGVWYQDPETMSTKSDGSIRITQSANISSALERIAEKHGVSKIVFGGDLNLDLDTHAISMLEQGTVAGNMPMRNLIREYREYGITGTRTELYRDYGKAGMSLYADYMFVSGDVNVHGFELIGAEVSDHMQMKLLFS
tara:strand:- start:12 stop:905 length:894 start_codon:yes stop_codon:yes gene_type:complete